jgi:hypothetical protein
MTDFRLKKEQREITHAVGNFNMNVIWRTGLSRTNVKGESI